MLVDKQSELMSDLLFTVHQHGGDDVTWKPPIKQYTRTYTQSGAENSLFQFCLTITEPFSPIYLEDMKVLSFSRTVNQVIMRVHKPKVEYKLALQLDPREHLEVYL